MDRTRRWMWIRTRRPPRKRKAWYGVGQGTSWLEFNSPKLIGIHPSCVRHRLVSSSSSPPSPFFFHLRRPVRSHSRQCLSLFLFRFSLPFVFLCYCSCCRRCCIGRMHSPCRWSCLFLLVISVIILPCRLALAAPPTRRSPSSSSEEASSSAAASIVWSSPAPGDRFGPGDTITGEWQVTSESQNQKVVSPSFRLCAGGEDGCGATVWPEVVAEESTGYYYVSLCVWAVAFSSYHSK